MLFYIPHVNKIFQYLSFSSPLLSQIRIPSSAISILLCIQSTIPLSNLILTVGLFSDLGDCEEFVVTPKFCAQGLQYEWVSGNYICCQGSNISAAFNANVLSSTLSLWPYKEIQKYRSQMVKTSLKPFSLKVNYHQVWDKRGKKRRKLKKEVLKRLFPSLAGSPY